MTTTHPSSPLLDAVVRALQSDARFSAWQVTEARGRSHQRYQVFSAVESRRVVETRACEVRVHVPVKGDDGTDRLGESSFTVVDEGQDLAPLLDAAHMRARLVKNLPWTLPAPGAVPSVRAVDPRIVEAPQDACDEVGAAIERASKTSGGVELSASEVFCDFRRVHLRNSRGLDVAREETSAYTEYVLLAKGKSGGNTDELEVYQSRRARQLADLQLAEQIDEDAKVAADSKRAVLPDTGIVDVVLCGSAVEELFDAFVAHAVGSSKFEGWSRFVEGQPVLAGERSGEALTLTSDATVPGGLGTFAFDDTGLPGARIDVVKDGVFLTRACDQRYACWLGQPATGTWGNTVVASGAKTTAELCVPGARPLYVLSRFSQLSPHATSGAFSGEIRYGTRSGAPIRGGSLSGVVFDAFLRAHFSTERMVRGRTLAPAAVRVDAVQITGADG